MKKRIAKLFRRWADLYARLAFALDQDVITIVTEFRAKEVANDIPDFGECDLFCGPDSLEQMLQIALDREDYETAALIRDKMQQNEA